MRSGKAATRSIPQSKRVKDRPTSSLATQPPPATRPPSVARPFARPATQPVTRPATRSPQLTLIKRQRSAYGGELRNTREGRSTARPLATRHSMHLVLRSTKAKGEWSFRHPKNRNRVGAIIKRFALKNGVRILSMANVGNHLHLHIKLGNRHSYAGFIRAVTGAIAQAVTGRTRWQNNQSRNVGSAKLQFWDYRPFTRIIESWRAVLNMRDYVRINQLEGFGVSRLEARAWLESKTRRPVLRISDLKRSDPRKPESRI